MKKIYNIESDLDIEASSSKATTGLDIILVESIEVSPFLLFPLLPPHWLVGLWMGT